MGAGVWNSSFLGGAAALGAANARPSPMPSESASAPPTAARKSDQAPGFAGMARRLQGDVEWLSKRRVPEQRPCGCEAPDTQTYLSPPVERRTLVIEKKVYVRVTLKKKVYVQVPVDGSNRSRIFPTICVTRPVFAARALSFLVEPAARHDRGRSLRRRVGGDRRWVLQRVARRLGDHRRHAIGGDTIIE